MNIYAVNAGVTGYSCMVSYGDTPLEVLLEARIDGARFAMTLGEPAKGRLCKLHKNEYLFIRLYIYSFLCNLHKNVYLFIQLYIYTFLCKLYKRGLAPLVIGAFPIVEVKGESPENDLASRVHVFGHGHFQIAAISGQRGKVDAVAKIDTEVNTGTEITSSKNHFVVLPGFLMRFCRPLMVPL